MPGVVATRGDVIVSSDHRLEGGEAVESVFEVRAEAGPPEKMRIGIRLVPENELKLSFRLRTELDMLSLRGR